MSLPPEQQRPAASVPPQPQPAGPPPTGFPAPPTPAPRSRRRWWIAAAAAIVLAVAAGTTVALWPSDEDRAVEHCHAAVRAKLFSPSTAEFADNVRQNNTPPVYRVLGDVDAENKFGATLHGEYICVLRHEDDGSWTTINATVITR